MHQAIRSKAAKVWPLILHHSGKVRGPPDPIDPADGSMSWEVTYSTRFPPNTGLGLPWSQNLKSCVCSGAELEALELS